MVRQPAYPVRLVGVNRVIGIFKEETKERKLEEGQWERKWGKSEWGVVAWIS